jgi:hypothetical protein
VQRTSLVRIVWVCAAVALAACDRADGVEVQPLPPLERPAAEARAGLPLVAGVWHFAGWEVANAEVGAALGVPARPGDLVVETQRIDSVAGFLARGEVRLPVVGEVRRDSIVSLVAIAEGATQRFAAGRVRADTLWIELSNLPAGEVSPPTVRWAFVRTAAGQPFFRLPTGELLRDTVVAQPTPMPAAPRTPAPAAEPPPAEPAPTAEPREPTAPQQPRPVPQPPAEEPAPPEPAPLPPPSPTLDIPPGTG